MKPIEHSPDVGAGKVIIALDCADPAVALGLAEQLRPEITWFKVGLELFTAAGPSVVQTLVQQGLQVFLDLKLHDIPHTVERAVAAIGRLGVGMTTLHGGGGRSMMQAAARARDETAAGGLKLLAVTVLTSLSAADLEDIGVGRPADQQALRLARLAVDSGLDGAVCSPLEVERLRAETPAGFLLVTPGIRRGGDSPDDQARAAGPAQALRSGASYLVVGRPITRAPDPRAAARQLLTELQATP